MTQAPHTGVPYAPYALDYMDMHRFVEKILTFGYFRGVLPVSPFTALFATYCCWPKVPTDQARKVAGLR